MKNYHFTVNGEVVTREAKSMKEAENALKKELLASLPREYTSKNPLVLKAYGAEGDSPYFACDGWLLFYPNGKNEPKARKTAEFRA